MSSESAKKRQKRSPCDAPDSSIADIEALFDQKLSRMEQTMQTKINSLQSEVDALKGRLSRVDELEKKCKHLEDKCASMGRSLKVLAGRWEFSEPDIPVSHWTERGHGEEYVSEHVAPFVHDIQREVAKLKEGSQDLSIYIGDECDQTLFHDDALLPHWQNLADALGIYGHLVEGGRGHLSVACVQLSQEVIRILTPSLIAMKGFRGIALDWNDFEHPQCGIDFAVRLLQSSPDVSSFDWVNNAIETEQEAHSLLEAIKSRPSIRHVRIENCCESSTDAGFHLLTSLVSGTNDFERIDLERNNIRTAGDTHLSEYLSTNPPLEDLCLERNKLDDNDALLIAEALKRNTNLKFLGLDRNDITETGRRALRNALCDETSLNSVAESNHICYITGIDSEYNSSMRSLHENRRGKIYDLLASTNAHQLDSELGDDSLALVPLVLERVNDCAEHWRSEYSSSLGVEDETARPNPLAIFYELARGWKMPSLYENGRRG